MQWFEEVVRQKLQFFLTNEKFLIRQMAMLMIKMLYPVVSEAFLNEIMFPCLIALGQDPVPNIKFNVAKTIDSLSDKLSAENKERSQELLTELSSDADVDVKFFAQKALEGI
jgi:serine/threonine-protein phosphatase 2A regulatory subunit A